MAQQTIIITCPACFTDFEVLEFDTQTSINVIQQGEHAHKLLNLSILAQINHDDCSAVPA